MEVLQWYGKPWLQLAVKALDWASWLGSYSKEIMGVQALHPPEYHYPEDLEQLRFFMDGVLG